MRAFRPMLSPFLVSALVSLSCTADPTTDISVPGPVASLSIEPTNAVVQVGKSTRLSAIARDSSGATLSGPVALWTSSNGGVARVVLTVGDVIGVAPGSAEVIATADGKTARAAITVTSLPPAPPPGPVASLSIEPTNAVVQVGKSTRLSAIARDSSGATLSGPVALWTTSNGGVAKVVLTVGDVIGVAPGSAEVIATADGKTARAAITVTLLPPAPPPPSGCTGVSVLPGASIQGAVNANPAGTTFCIRAGLYRRQSVTPKSGDQFIGDAGAIMDGENVAVGAFYGGTSPTPANVVIKNLKIMRYNPPGSYAAVWAENQGVGGSNWVVENNEITENSTGGIRLWHGMQVRGNNIHHNHQQGLIGSGDNILIENNEIAYNNYLNEFAAGIEAGGTKFVRTNNLIVRNNFSHHNHGPGLWADIGNLNVLYENNLIEDNFLAGIKHEISFAAIIRNNTIRRNGASGGVDVGWIWSGGIEISTSHNVEIYGNTLEDNRVGVSVIEQPVAPSVYWTDNINVHDNIIRQTFFSSVPVFGIPAGAAGYRGTAGSSWYNTITFQNNHYFVTAGNGERWEWNGGGGKTWAAWQAFGNDLTGSMTSIP